MSGGAGTIHRIHVRLPTASLGTNLAAVKVNLTGPGPDPDLAEALFTASQTGDQFVTIVEPPSPNPFVYQYSITGYTPQGIPVRGDAGQSSDPNLVVRLPGS